MLLGGTLSADTGPGRGTTIRVVFPASALTAQPEPGLPLQPQGY